MKVTTFNYRKHGWAKVVLTDGWGRQFIGKSPRHFDPELARQVAFNLALEQAKEVGHFTGK